MRSAGAAHFGPPRAAGATAAFGALSPWWDRIVAARAWPDAATLDRWAGEAGLRHRASGRALRFVRSTGRVRAVDYERRIADLAQIAVRERDAHDAMNALAWLAWPATKSALNAVHVDRGEAPTANGRDRARDAATLLDESGLVLACDAPTARALRSRDWRTFFRLAHAPGSGLVAAAIGHGLLVKCLAPYAALTAQVLMLDATADAAARASHDTLDARAATAVADAAFAPVHLTPLPVAALPGWDFAGTGIRMLDDLSVFRRPR